MNIRDLEQRHDPLWWQQLGKTYTRTGYGSKIPTSRKVRLPGERRWRRLYCCVYSNSGTLFVIKDGVKLFLEG